MKKFISTILLMFTITFLMSAQNVYAESTENAEEATYLSPDIYNVHLYTDRITFSWTECDYADYYKVKYKIGKDNYKELNTEYTDYQITNPKLNNGTKIIIKVEAINEIEQLDYSSEYTTYYFDSVKLKMALSPSSKKLSLEWTTNNLISNYQIRYSAKGELKTVSVGNKNNYTLNLNGNKKYSVKVRGYKEINGERYYTNWSNVKTVITKYNKWDKILDTYEKDPNTNQIVLVKYISGSSANIEFYEKKNGKFKLVLSEKGCVGKKGIDKVKEGDLKTPTGTFNLTTAFGIKSNPGTKIKYTKVNEDLWWCSDSQYYNTLINIKKKPHNCKGEHLAHYGSAYNYCLFIDYNKEGKYKKGCAIFLHCRKTAKSTAGCVALSEKNMKTIIKKVDKGAKICIYKES